MAPLGVHRYVKQLVTDHPEKAVDILVRCCDDERIYSDIMTCLVQPSQGRDEALSPRNSLNITLAPPSPMSPVDSQHSGSPRPLHRLPHHPISSARPFAPLSPPRTASSVTSHASRDGAASPEYVFFFTSHGRVIDETLVRMRTAHIKHSVIRQDIVHNRHLLGSLNQLEPSYVSVTRSATPHARKEVQTSCSIELEWSRPHSEMTHRTTFYLVSGDALDTDVLLGYDDSGEGASGMYTTLLW